MVFCKSCGKGQGPLPGNRDGAFLEPLLSHVRPWQAVRLARLSSTGDDL